MKNILYIFMAISTIILASCSADIEDTAITGEATTITLSVEGAESRATTFTPPQRYIIEVYNEDGSYANVLPGKKYRAMSTTGEFSATFDRAKAYRCVFWADAANSEFDANNLKEIRPNNGFLTKEAFYGNIDIEKGKNSAISVKLKRAVAKVTLNETQTLDVGTSISFKIQNFRAFDASTGLGSQVIDSYTKRLTIAEGKTSGNIMEFYVLSTEAGNTRDISFSTGTEPERTISAVPLKQNFRTNLNGAFAKYINKKITVTIDENWGTPDNEYEESTPYGWYLKGKESGKFEIKTAEQLREFARIANRGISSSVIPGGIAQDDFTGKTVTLTADIDLKNEEWTPIGALTEEFKGTFDGNGKTVSNLKITKNLPISTFWSEVSLGFFGYINLATIKDLTFENSDISLTTNSSHNDFVGTLFGVGDNSLILNVIIKGELNITINTPDKNSVFVGGLFGLVNKNVVLINCAVNPSSADYHIDCIGSEICIGGIGGTLGGTLGNMELSNIINCYSTANTKTTFSTQNNYIGGLIGTAQCNFFNNYASGNIETKVLDSSNYYIGGIVSSSIISLVNSFTLQSSIKATGTSTDSMVGKILGKGRIKTGRDIFSNPNMKFILNGSERTTFNGISNGTNLSASPSAPWWSVPGGKAIVDKLNEYVTANPTYNYNGTAIPLKKWKPGTSEKCPAVFVD